MHLTVNELLEVTDTNDNQDILRVLWVNPRHDVVVVIRINDPKALPETRKQSDLENPPHDVVVRELTQDPYASLHQPEDRIPIKHRRRRDSRFELIQPITELPNGGAFDPAIRGPVIEQIVRKSRSTKKQIYSCLRQFWRGGLLRNTLLPSYKNSGAPGKPRPLGKAKRGRPRLLTQLEGYPPGINVDSDKAALLKKGYRQFYEKQPQDGGLTKRKAYQKTLETYFKSGMELRGGVLTPVLPPAHELPSFEQFIYWATKNLDVRESLTRRNGERKFNLKNRAILKDSFSLASGPGQLYQIDSTQVDVMLVSALDRSRRIGRPTLFVVVDTFSHQIVGFYAGVDNPSVFSAGLAIENAIADKVAYCALSKIEITPDQWPASGLPEAILADRGELEGDGASQLVASLNINLANTAPYRADLKGIAERTFRSINDLLVHSLPGAIPKPKERGERDAILEAALTLHDFRRLMIHAILEQNARRIESLRLDEDMIAEGLEPRPLDLWNWGIRNRTGHLRSMDSSIVKANLLPPAKAVVSDQGIKLRNVRFSSERALAEGWFERARSTKTWRVDVTYDPRLVDTIYLRPSGNQTVEECHLLEVDDRFRGASWAEVDDFFLSQKMAQGRSKTKDLQAKVDLEAQVNSIVQQATTEAKTANAGLNKTERKRDVRTNRDAERREDHAAAVTAADTNSSKVPPTQPEQPDFHASQEEPATPPSMIEMLKRKRDQKWSDNE